MRSPALEICTKIKKIRKAYIYISKYTYILRDIIKIEKVFNKKEELWKIETFQSNIYKVPFKRKAWGLRPKSQKILIKI